MLGQPVTVNVVPTAAVELPPTRTSNVEASTARSRTAAFRWRSRPGLSCPGLSVRVPVAGTVSSLSSSPEQGTGVRVRGNRAAARGPRPVRRVGPRAPGTVVQGCSSHQWGRRTVVTLQQTRAGRPGTCEQTAVGMSTIARGRHVRDPRHPLATLLLRGVATALAALLVVGVTAGAVLVRRLEGNITAVDISGQLGDDRPEAVEESFDSLTILLIGSDTREGLEDDSDAAVVAGQRADTTIVLHLSAERDRAQLVSIPRDSMVQMPDCILDDGTTVEGGLKQFNAAFSIGGAACVQRTVEQLTGVPIDHYAVVNFDGFRSIVDALGGVEVCTSEPISDPDSGLVLPAGTTTVAGDQALAYVRARKFGDGSDTARIARQQAFLSSMVQEVTSTGLLARPDRLIGVLDAGTKSLTTDPGLDSVAALASVARSVQGLPPEAVSFLTIPNEPWPRDPNRLVWTDDAELVWEALRTDEPLPGQEPDVAPSESAPPAPADLTVSPDQITLDVVNAGGPGGSAGAAAEDLLAQGFDVGAVTNGDEDVTGIRILVPAGKDEAALTVQAAFAGSVLVRDDTVPDITVQLGAGAGFVQEVPNRLGTEPLPERTAPAAAEPSIEVRAAVDDICS